MTLQEELEQLINLARKQNTYSKGKSGETFTLPDNHISITIAELSKLIRKHNA